MGREWIAYTEAGHERELEAAISSLGRIDAITFAKSASHMRECLHDEEPHTVCAAIGLADQGVSDVNLAAAVVADGYAEEVVLVVREASGSLRSRAARAGIDRVVALNELGRGRRPSAGSGGTQAPSVASQVAQRVPEVGDALAPSATYVAWQAARARREAARKPGAAPIVTFASGRGGVGKTTLVSACAALAARWDMRVALCDVDFSCGNLANSFGTARRSDLSCLDEVPELTPAAIAAAGVACGERISLWGPCARPELAETIMPHVGDLLRGLSDTHDLVMVDTSSTCTDAVAQAMQLADRLVLMHDVRPGGIAALARTSALAVRLGVARTRIVRVENRCAVREWGKAFIPRAEVGLETARPFRVLEGGDEVAELLAAGKCDELIDLEGDFVRSTASFLAQVLKELGSLPDNADAHAAEEGLRPRRVPPLFGRRREAV